MHQKLVLIPSEQHNLDYVFDCCCATDFEGSAYRTMIGSSHKKTNGQSIPDMLILLCKKEWSYSWSRYWRLSNKSCCDDKEIPPLTFFVIDGNFIYAHRLLIHRPPIHKSSNTSS